MQSRVFFAICGCGHILDAVASRLLLDAVIWISCFFIFVVVLRCFCMVELNC
jgi:hypothetical protein